MIESHFFEKFARQLWSTTQQQSGRKDRKICIIW